MINKIKNIEKLNEFLDLRENWNGNNAKPFKEEVIDKCIDLINLLSIDNQPEIFPTARNTIQFEYDNKNKYLEFEISEKSIDGFFSSENIEKTFISISFKTFFNKITEFYLW